MSGAVFTKGLSQVLGLVFVQKYSQLKPETWLRPFVNMAPGFRNTFAFCTQFLSVPFLLNRVSLYDSSDCVNIMTQ